MRHPALALQHIGPTRMGTKSQVRTAPLEDCLQGHTVGPDHDLLDARSEATFLEVSNPWELAGP